MKSFFDWFGECNSFHSKPWLILGKGPSFAKVSQFDIDGFARLSLNDAARELSVDVAHAIDLQVIERSGDAIVRNAKVLVMPWHPHVDFRPARENLEEISSQDVYLRQLKSEGRLLWYNLGTAKDHRLESPVVGVRYFSAEAAINLLAQAGVRLIRSLGVDGGNAYSSRFKDLKDKSLLTNRRSSFDRQFEEIARTILRTGVDFAPLDIDSPIRVYVATMPEQMLAVKVLEYSIKKHASMTTEVFPLHLSEIKIPQPRDQKNLPRTPFSFQRFLIPELAGRKGRAIYLDSDMQVFRDIKDLWTMPFDGAGLLAVRTRDDSTRRPQFSVMLLDCMALDWDIERIVVMLDSGDLAYEDLMYEMKVARSVRSAIDPSWNSLEFFREGETALLHYTDMHTQPWVDTTNPLGYLWFRDLFEAIDSGFITEDFVAEEIRRGHVRPSLGYQVEHGIEDCLLLPRKARKLDEGFVAPYVQIDNRKSGVLIGFGRKIRAFARTKYRRVGLYELKRRFRNRLCR